MRTFVQLQFGGIPNTQPISFN